MSKKQNKALFNFIVLCISCIIAYVVLLNTSDRLFEKRKYLLQPLDSNWQISINDKVYDDVSLSAFTFPQATTGDYIVMKRTLEPTYILSPVLRVNFWYSVVDVFFDGEPAYSYGRDLHEKGKNVGAGVHIIPIDSRIETSPIELEIHLNVTEPRSFGSFQMIYLDSADTCFAPLLREHIFTFASSIFLTLFGGLGILVSIFLVIFKLKNDKVYLTTFAFMVLLGFTALFSGDCAFLFNKNYNFNCWMEYISIMFSILALSYLSYLLIAPHRWQRSLLKGYAGFFLMFAITAIILDSLGVCHFPAIRFVLMGLIAVGMIIDTIIAVYNLVKKYEEVGFSSFGILCLFVLINLDYTRMQIFRYTNFHNMYTSNSALAMGALVFLISMTVNFVNSMQEDVAETVKTQLMKNYFETDIVTGLSNSEKCYQSIVRMEQTHDKNYYVMYLRFVGKNDTSVRFDTMASDDFLEKAGKLLNKFFGYYGSVSRLHDSTFCISVSDITEIKVKQLMESFNHAFEKEFGRNVNTPYDLKCGIASRTETEDIKGLVTLAETRMEESIPLLLSE